MNGSRATKSDENSSGSALQPPLRLRRISQVREDIMTTKAEARVARLYRRAEDAHLADLQALTAAQTVLADYPFAASVQKNVLLYDAAALRPLLSEPHRRQEIMAEWADAMANGPGVVVLKHAEPDMEMLDQASDLFRRLIKAQNDAGTAGGDHFAKPGANDRLWNSLEKHCLADPQNFARYYGNPFLAAISEAWLGPHYQFTAQLNVVNPGGAAQTSHRDYHLGFQSAQDVARYPMPVQLFSSMLTLQGAIAHVDAPMETGPTQLLPFSQLWAEGYLGASQEGVCQHFAANHIQVPLEKGDMLFFSPALLHAAGANRTTNVRRMVNLFQVSSAYGRSIETVDRVAMCKALYPALLTGNLSEDQIDCALATCAEGYSFPTNLDRDPPLGGMAPKTQSQLMKEALLARLEPEMLNKALDAQAERRRS
jgi:ectoine hydroxylase-related dioxygenase (phytanoyl-CoA dioxygenase family)